MNTPGIIWLVVCFIILSTIRILQYKKIYGLSFSLLHVIIDIIIIGNPINLITIPIYIVIKYYYFKKNNKNIGKWFPYIDILLLIICLGLFSIISQLYVNSI